MVDAIAFGSVAVRSAGNSLIITIPRDVVEALELSVGDKLLIKTDGKRLYGEKSVGVKQR